MEVLDGKCLAFDGIHASVPARLSARMPAHPLTRLAGCRGAHVRVRVEIDRKSHANAARPPHLLPLVSAATLALAGQLLARGQAFKHVRRRRHRRVMEGSVGGRGRARVRRAGTETRTEPQSRTPVATHPGAVVSCAPGTLREALLSGCCDCRLWPAERLIPRLVLAPPRHAERRRDTPRHSDRHCCPGGSHPRPPCVPVRVVVGGVRGSSAPSVGGRGIAAQAAWVEDSFEGLRKRPARPHSLHVSETVSVGR